MSSSIQVGSKENLIATIQQKMLETAQKIGGAQTAAALYQNGELRTDIASAGQQVTLSDILSGRADSMDPALVLRAEYSLLQSLNDPTLAAAEAASNSSSSSDLESAAASSGVDDAATQAYNSTGSGYQDIGTDGTDSSDGSSQARTFSSTDVSSDGSTTQQDMGSADLGSATTYEDGTTVNEDGSTTFSDGSSVSGDGTTTFADGSSVGADGTTTFSDGSSVESGGSDAFSDGSSSDISSDGSSSDISSDGSGVSTSGDGAITFGDGSVLSTDGTLTLGDGSTANVTSASESAITFSDGSALSSDGNLTLSDGSTTQIGAPTSDGSSDGGGGTNTNTNGSGEDGVYTGASDVAANTAVSGTPGKADFTVTGTRPFSTYEVTDKAQDLDGQPGNTIEENKAAINAALDAAGASPEERALVMALAMQETGHLDPNERDTSKDDKPYRNYSAFNLTDALLAKCGYTGSPESANDRSNMGNVVTAIVNGLRDPNIGADTLLTEIRGGVGGDPSQSVVSDFKNGIATAINEINNDPSLFTDNRRVGVSVDHI